MGRCLAGSEGSAGRSCCTLGSVALLGEGQLRAVCKRVGLPAVDSGCSGFVVAVVVVVAAVVVVVVAAVVAAVVEIVVVVVVAVVVVVVIVVCEYNNIIQEPYRKPT